jgi:putative spermidine/putrescine transport system permease protein
MRSSHAARCALLLGPLTLFLVLLYVAPLVGVMRWSVTRPQLGVHQYVVALTDPLIVSVLKRTLRVCIIATLVSVTAAYAIALVWVRGSPRQRLLVEFCILIPFWISVLTRAFGWLAFLSNRGILNNSLQWLGIISDPLPLVRNEFGVTVGIVHYLIPYAVFPLAASIRGVDERVLLAARSMGASRARVFWQVLVPMTQSGILGALLVVFVFSLGFFIVPAILGGGRSIMASEMIYLLIFQNNNWGLAAATSVILMVVVALFVPLMRRVLPKGAS